jgi:CheY-like chemotaxis protein
MLDRTENQETILVVEDDVLVRMPISQYLRDCGYKVIEATNAEEAKTILSHKETVINLILWRNGHATTGLAWTCYLVDHYRALFSRRKNCAMKVRYQSRMMRN